MNLGSWGARMSEAQKKQSKSPKNRLEKTYILDFNTKESLLLKKKKWMQFLVRPIPGARISQEEAI